MGNVLTFEIEADEIEMFLQDVNEHLAAMEAGILRLEQTSDSDVLNATFRAAHTIKAIASAVGHRQMAEITHVMETVFDAMRKDGLSPTQAVIDGLLTVVDVLKALRDEVVTGQPSGVDAAAFLDSLRALAGRDDGGRESEEPGFPASGATKTWFLLTPEQVAQARDYSEAGLAILEVEAAVRSDAFAQSASLLQAAMAVEKMGHVVVQRPSLADLTSGQHSGHLWLVLATQAGVDVVEQALGRIADLAEFRVQSYDPDGMAETSTDIPVPASPALREPAVDAQDGRQAARLNSTKSVRISVERLDTLMNLVGELVTDRTRLIQIQEMLRVQYGKNGAVGALGDMAAHFDRVVDQLQEEVMEARMLPIANLFSKFPRLVRDVARASGKQVNLVIEGETTELDRSVIEVIGDPLIHLLRNAVDHGIESPQERIAAGKPPTGVILLAAAHEEGHVVITVRDDGRGIDQERIRRSAVSRGLLSEEDAAQLDDDAAISLIFQPNLSTAGQVTGVSGRGVGLDIVRTNVKRLGGAVVVESEVGRGTTFRVTLPLTLAIVQAMMIALGNDVYAIPLANIVETLYLADAITGSVKGKPVIQWRDRVLPLVHLRRFFDRGDEDPVSGKQAVVTVAWGKLQVSLIVDRLIGKQEIVVKSLGPFIGNVPALSGCTILGDGRVALIVDISGLISVIMGQARKSVFDIPWQEGARVLVQEVAP